MRPSQAWRMPKTIIIEVCGECGEKNIGRDVCPKCGARIVPEGENISQALREGRMPEINGEIGVCVPQYGGYGKERGG